MATTKKISKYTCACCGEPLDDNNSFVSPTKNGLNPYCVNCQQDYYEKLSETCGAHLAIYICCAKYDVPCNPLILPNDISEEEINKLDGGENGVWIYYLNKIIETDLYNEEEEVLPTFFDGVTNILRIFGRNFSEKDFAKYVEYEAKTPSGLPGTAHQRRVWGVIPLYKNVPMTTERYAELDRRYEARMARMKGITIDAQLEDIQRRLCKISLAQDYLLSIGEVGGFDKLQKTADNIQASEQLRKKDEKPVEAYSIDAQVKALEDAGLMEDGKFLDLDGVQKSLIKHFIEKKKYDYPIDALDHVIADIWNTMRANADVMISTELPHELKPKDEFGEFDEEENEEYQKVKKYAGLTKVIYQEPD